MKEEIESQIADKDLLSILELEGNKTCNDCGKKDPRWCSINNAVLLCSSCARTHKKFNKNISNIKSLEVDEWTKEEISYLKSGGNERFTKLIKSYNIPLTKENQEYKYYTKAAQYYRDILLEESKNSDINKIVKPSLKEGIEILYKEEYSNLFNKYNDKSNNENNLNKISENENNTVINNNIEDNNNTPMNNNNNTYYWVDKFINSNVSKSEFFNNITSNMIYAFNGVKERAKDIDFKEKIKLAGEYVQDKTEKIQNSETFKGIVNSVSTGIGNFIHKTDKFLGYKVIDNNQLNIGNLSTPLQNNPTQNNINDNTQLNSPYIQNKEENSNNAGLINNIINKIDEPKFKSNYSSINNDKNDQYNNYINELNEKGNANEKNNLNINNDNGNKIDENDKKDDLKNNDENIEKLDDNIQNPNLLIMSNNPNNI